LLRDVAQYRMMAFGFTLAAIIILRPQGLVPRSFGPVRLLRWLLVS
jgi:branched-chain amino acid transport system permease protein